jgi:hypothetical protein
MSEITLDARIEKGLRAAHDAIVPGSRRTRKLSHNLWYGRSGTWPHHAITGNWPITANSQQIKS